MILSKSLGYSIIITFFYYTVIHKIDWFSIIFICIGFLLIVLELYLNRKPISQLKEEELSEKIRFPSINPDAPDFQFGRSVTAGWLSRASSIFLINNKTILF